MALDLVLLHGAEGAKAHVERHVPNSYPLGDDLLQKLLGKVEARRGCGGAAQFPGVNGLIPLPVLQFLSDIGRQGHFAQAFQNLQENSLVVELHQPVAALHLADDLAGQFSVPKGHLRAGTHLFARADKTLPDALPLVHQQQHLAGPAAGQPMAQKTGGQNAGVVQNQAVPLCQEIWKLVKMVVLPGPRGLVQRQQTRRVPLFNRRLRNEFLGQVVVKIAGLHENLHGSAC
ncbi:hypothetical protein SDC9_128464 [bioreactor metagenome]|uniref:Uncharacterized protein n=1 Tax=bioreactor metagenome TaxID=1076179 RepID=A0A645CWX7_9ZZZZ